MREGRRLARRLTSRLIAERCEVGVDRRRLTTQADTLDGVRILDGGSANDVPLGVLLPDSLPLNPSLRKREVVCEDVGDEVGEVGFWRGLLSVRGIVLPPADVEVDRELHDLPQVVAEIIGRAAVPDVTRDLLSEGIGVFADGS